MSKSVQKVQYLLHTAKESETLSIPVQNETSELVFNFFDISEAYVCETVFSEQVVAANVTVFMNKNFPDNYFSIHKVIYGSIV